MKKLVTIVLASCMAVAALAQPQGGHRHQGGKPDFDRIKAQQVAFITDQVGLTAKEAESFWPVYNKIEDQQKELRKAEMDAYKALDEALRDGKGNVDALLDKYLKAKEANINLHVKNAKDYKKVLSAEKLAKFFTCEEKFRREQIGRMMGGDRGSRSGHGMKGGHKGHKGHMGGAPGEGFRGAPGQDFKGFPGKPGEGFAPRGERPQGQLPPAKEGNI